MLRSTSTKSRYQLSLQRRSSVGWWRASSRASGRGTRAIVGQVRDGVTGNLTPMLAFLSDAWVAALHEAASTDADLHAACSTIALTVEQEVTGGPDGDVRYHV